MVKQKNSYTINKGNLYQYSCSPYKLLILHWQILDLGIILLFFWWQVAIIYSDITRSDNLDIEVHVLIFHCTWKRLHCTSVQVKYGVGLLYYLCMYFGSCTIFNTISVGKRIAFWKFRRAQLVIIITFLQQKVLSEMPRNYKRNNTRFLVLKIVPMFPSSVYMNMFIPPWEWLGNVLYAIWLQYWGTGFNKRSIKKGLADCTIFTIERINCKFVWSI